MKYNRITIALLFCFAFTFLLSAQTENLQTKVIDGKEFYIYKVKPSEGFYILSHKFGISQEEIIRYNPAAKNGLKKGQLLMIPTNKGVNKQDSEPEIESTFEQSYGENHCILFQRLIKSLFEALLHLIRVLNVE